MKKILIFPSWYPSQASSINGIFVREQAIALSQKYDIAVLFPFLVGWRQVIEGGGNSKSQFDDPVLKVYRERAFVPVPRLLSLLYYLYVRGILHSPDSLSEILQTAIYFSSYYQATKRAFKRVLATWGKPDVIHAHVVLPAGWAASNLGKQYGIPVVLTEHSSPFSVHLRSNYQRRLVRETLEQSRRTVAVSPWMERQIRAFQPDVHIEVIGNLIRTRFFIPPAESHPREGDMKRFLFVGLLSDQKGVAYLLQAARLLIQRGSKYFELLIGGDGPIRHQLEQMAQAFELTGRCRFLGLLSQGEVRYWMQQCDVFVLPSQHETFGIVLGEAMACGKPVIATRAGGPEFVVTPETGILVDVANPVALADAMERFISGQQTYDSRRIRQSVITRFGEEAFLQRISKVYDQICAEDAL